jgi:hypothetical protein
MAAGTLLMVGAIREPAVRAQEIIAPASAQLG